jgi:hypothetical protein
MLDMLQRKIDTHDREWFITVAGHKNSYVMLTEPEDPAEWTRVEV